MSEITLTLSRRRVDRPAVIDAGAPSGHAGPGHALRGMQELHEGEQAVIVRVCDGSDAACARRLFDLGFAPGASVVKVRRAPFGGPAVYRIADYEIALRPEQARTILVGTESSEPVQPGAYAARSFAA